MGPRSCIEDVCLRKTWETEEESYSGFLVGQRSETADILAFSVKTPKESSIKKENFDTRALNVNWMIQHGKQVSGMLPGGIKILGLYISDSPQIFKSQSHVHQIQKILIEVQKIQKEQESDYIIYIRHDSSLSLIYFNALNGSFKGVESKIETLNWQRLECNLILDIPFLIKDTSSPLLIQLETLLSSFSTLLESHSTLLFDGTCKETKELLNPSSKSKQRPSTEKVEETKIIYVDILFHKDIQSLSGVSDESIEKESSLCRLGGKVYVTAFMHSRATVGEAIDGIVTDVLRTLSSRFILHCDSDQVVESDGQKESSFVLHEPPRRIMIPFPNSAICISDYIHSGETTWNAIETIEDIFGFIPDQETMDDDVERDGNTKEIEAAENDFETPEISSYSYSTIHGPLLGWISLGIAFVAMTLYYTLYH